MKGPKKEIEVKPPAITFVKAGRKNVTDKKKIKNSFSHFNKDRNQASRLRKRILDNFM